jgi:hypothetical protein
MATETRAYENEHGDPVVVTVTTGTFDVSRLINVLARGRCEEGRQAGTAREQLRRHRKGREAIRLLRQHGGPDLTDPGPDEPDLIRQLVKAEADRDATWAEVDRLTAERDRARNAAVALDQELAEIRRMAARFDSAVPVPMLLDILDGAK